IMRAFAVAPNANRSTGAVRISKNYRRGLSGCWPGLIENCQKWRREKARPDPLLRYFQRRVLSFPSETQLLPQYAMVDISPYKHNVRCYARRDDREDWP